VEVEQYCEDINPRKEHDNIMTMGENFISYPSNPNNWNKPQRMADEVLDKWETRAAAWWATHGGDRIAFPYWWCHERVTAEYYFRKRGGTYDFDGCDGFFFIHIDDARRLYPDRTLEELWECLWAVVLAECKAINIQAEGKNYVVTLKKLGEVMDTVDIQALTEKELIFRAWEELQNCPAVMSDADEVKEAVEYIALGLVEEEEYADE